MRILATSVILFLTNGFAQAEAPLIISGPGNSSCEETIKIFRKETGPMAVHLYVSGYVSGRNSTFLELGLPVKDLSGLVLAGETFENNGMVNPLLRYCVENPDHSLLRAAEHLYDQIP